MIKLVCSLIVIIGMTVSGNAQTTSTVHSGNFAAQITRISGSGDSGLDRDLSAYRLSVTPGTSVTMTYWIRNGQPTSSTIARAALVFFDGAGTYLNPPGDLNYHQSQDVPTVWTQFTAGPVAVPATAAKMNVSFRLNANSNVVIDDVSVLQSSGGPGTEIITNGGFETWPGAATDQPTDWRFFAVGGATGAVLRLGTFTAAGRDWLEVR